MPVHPKNKCILTTLNLFFIRLVSPKYHLVATHILLETYISLTQSIHYENLLIHFLET